MPYLRYISMTLLGYALLTGGAKTAERAVSASAVVKENAAAAADDDLRDVLLMLDDGPLHLRFHVTLGGVSLAAARSAYVDRLMQTLDTDRDGKLSPEEAARSPLRTTRRRDAAAEFLNSLDGKRVETRKDIVQAVERAGGEMVVYHQDMTASKNDREVFKFLDSDNSGFLDRAEMAAAAMKIMERDQDQDECISFQEFLPAPEPDPQPGLVPQRPAAERPATTRDLVHDIREPTLPARLIKKYDRNRDNKLSPAELGWPADRVKMLDTNADGKLSLKELTGVGGTPVDLELAVDLDGPPDGKAALEIISTLGKRVDDAKRPDVVRLVFAKAVVTFSFRKIDSIKTAIEKAMRGFNQIDVDGNGYLDATETAMRVRFERELADLDADGDGKIFGEEMEKYVAARAEPMATTARISVYDTGRGFFESLDTNGDGRISMREVKSSAKSLQRIARRNSEKLAPEDPVRNFHIEFTRGIYMLFREVGEQTAPQTPGFEQRVPIGPEWFKRMDRNSDGDLTWNEFLGPRHVFHRLDTDGDGLIDPQEAAAASEE
jgi:Ca2+-binding EF-hand superfamily protein